MYRRRTSCYEVSVCMLEGEEQKEFPVADSRVSWSAGVRGSRGSPSIVVGPKE